MKIGIDTLSPICIFHDQISPCENPSNHTNRLRIIHPCASLQFPWGVRSRTSKIHKEECVLMKEVGAMFNSWLLDLSCTFQFSSQVISHFNLMKFCVLLFKSHQKIINKLLSILFLPYQILRPTKRPPHVSEFPIILVLCAVLGFLFLVLIIAFLAKKYAHHGRGSMDQEPLIPNTQTPEKGTPGTYKSEVQIHLRGQ